MIRNESEKPLTKSCFAVIFLVALSSSENKLDISSWLRLRLKLYFSVGLTSTSGAEAWLGLTFKILSISLQVQRTSKK